MSHHIQLVEGNISEHRNGLCFPLARTISQISIPTPTTIHTKGQRTPSEPHRDAPGFCDSAEENVSQPGTAETGGSLETDLLRNKQGWQGQSRAVQGEGSPEGNSVQTTGNAGREDR